LTQKVNEISKTRRKLASGLAVQTAADNAADLSKDVRLATKMRSALKARLNLNHSISLAQTAESDLTSLINPLHRLKELGLQAMNEVYSDEDRRYMQEEVDSIMEGLSDTVEQSTFNGHQLLNGDFQAQVTMGGTTPSDGVSLNLDPFRFEDTVLTYSGDQDIVFALDATGSMQGAIDDLAAGLGDFVASFLDDVSGGEVRINIIAYTEGHNALTPVGQDWEETGFFTVTKDKQINQTGVDNLQNYLDNLTTSGGVEPLDEVFDYIDNNVVYRDDAKQSLFVIGSVGDEATNATVGANALVEAQELLTNNPQLTMHTVAVSGGTGTSTYFRDELTPIGDGVYLEFPAGGGIAEQLSKLLVTDVDGVNLVSSEEAVRSTAWIDYFLDKIDVERSKVGGFLAGLEQKLSLNQGEEVIEEAVRGRLSSADYAQLSVELSKNTMTLNSNVTMRSEMINTYGAALMGMIESWGIQ
jgi:flagellin-like hook-associated protein FlgL